MANSSIRIIAGQYKGRVIPFDVRRFNEADITTQKVKKALFDIISPLDNKIFVDLYGGSGQMGFEALSRGCAQVIICETDRSRFRFISSFTSFLPNKDNVLLLNMPASQALKLIAKREILPDYIFADPPYNKTGSGFRLYSDFIADVERFFPEAGTEIIIQHFSKNLLPEHAGSFLKTRERAYGSTTLSFYQFN